MPGRRLYRPKLGYKRGWRRLGSGVAFTVALLGSSSPATEAAGPGPVPRAAPLPPAPLVDVRGGRVTVDLRDAELEDVLEQIAARAGFRLEIAGELGSVTVAFRGLPLEHALRRLAQEHGLMLVYSAAGDGRAETRLLEVEVFATYRARAASGAAPGTSERDAALGEINRLAFLPNKEEAVSQLAELLRTASDAAVRARAVWALGKTRAARAALELATPLSDREPQVRVQAAYALRRVEGRRAIPALGDLLLGDPDVMVRRAAARMLGMLPDSASTSALSMAAGDADASVRQAVSRALERWGTTAPR